VHYYFLSKEDFLKEVEIGNFIEHNEVHGNFYGTNKKQVLEVMEQGKVCILDIDVKGARDIKNNGSIECNYVFVKTPTIDDLKARLVARGTETEETLAKRLGNAESEQHMAVECGFFKKFLVNDQKDLFIKEALEYVLK
jgi:guanylate kinase